MQFFSFVANITYAIRGLTRVNAILSKYEAAVGSSMYRFIHEYYRQQ